MSLLSRLVIAFNMLSRLVIAFLPRSKHLLISWLQSPSAVILEHRKIKSVTVSIVSPSISYQPLSVSVYGGDIFSFKESFCFLSFFFFWPHTTWHAELL